jgi:ketosteroid isomerase-like protein
VAAVPDAYNVALNSADTNAVMPFYTDGGVFMPSNNSSAVGCASVQEAHGDVLAAIRLTVKLNIAEIVEMSSDRIFARTNSAGTTLNHATGMTSAEGNQLREPCGRDSRDPTSRSPLPSNRSPEEIEEPFRKDRSPSGHPNNPAKTLPLPD